MKEKNKKISFMLMIIVTLIIVLIIMLLSKYLHTHKEEVIPALDATCEEAGLTEGKKCSKCGKILVPQTEIPALGHNYIDGICSCGKTDPTYKKEIDYREEYNIYNDIDIIEEASEEEIKNIISKWNDNLKGEIETEILYDRKKSASIKYDFSKEDLNDSIFKVEVGNVRIELINKVLKSYLDGIEKQSESLAKYNNLNNLEFKNKVILECTVIDVVILAELKVIMEEYVNEVINVNNYFYTYFIGLKEATPIGYDKNGNLVMDLIFETGTQDYNGRFVSDKDGNLLYCETLSFEGVELSPLFKTLGSWCVLTYEK